MIEQLKKGEATRRKQAEYEQELADLRGSISELQQERDQALARVQELERENQEIMGTLETVEEEMNSLRQESNNNRLLIEDMKTLSHEDRDLHKLQELRQEILRLREEK